MINQKRQPIKKIATPQPTKKSEFFWLLGLFVFWRLGLFLLAYAAPLFLKYQPSFPYVNMLVASGLPRWLYSWANFDGVHYLTIARQGYFGTGLIQAFFPVFPFSLKLIHQFTGLNLITIGLLISNLSTLVSLLLINASLKLWRFSWRQRFIVLITFLSLPGSLFLGAVYTEGLFVMLVWLNLYLVAQKKYWWASLVALVASATRLTGVFLVLPIIYDYLAQRGLLQHWSQAKKIFHYQNLSRLFYFSFVGSLGLLGYMFYLNQVYHDPLYFLHVQHEFGLDKAETIILYPQVLWRAFKILLTVCPFNLKYLTYVEEFLGGTVGLGLILWSWQIKKMPRYVFWLSLAFFFLPTMIGTFSSMSRYLLPAASLPLSFLLIEQKNRWLFVFTLIGIIGLLLINTVMFIQGYWVA